MIKTFGMIVFNKKGEVLLVRHEKAAGHVSGVYGFPAGRPEGKELPVETAVREAKEEAGAAIESAEVREMPHEYVADISRADGTTKTFSLRLFIKDGYEGAIHKGTEECTPQWVAPTELDSLKLLPSVKQAVSDAKQFLAS